MVGPVAVDRKLPDVEQAAAGADALRRSGGFFRKPRRIVSVRKLFYPVHVVEYEYTTESGRLRSRTRHRTERLVVDAVPTQDEPGRTQTLQKYASGFESHVMTQVERTPAAGPRPAHFERPAVFTHRRTEQAAGDLLVDRFEEVGDSVREQRQQLKNRAEQLQLQGKHEEAEETAKKIDDVTATDVRDEVFTGLPIPDAVTRDTFAGVVDVMSAYLPFWLVQYGNQQDSPKFEAFRDVDRSLRGYPNPETDTWVGTWLGTSRAAARQVAKTNPPHTSF